MRAIQSRIRKLTSTTTAPRKLWRGLLSLGVIAVLAGSAARAQDFDQGKSGAKLFATNCASCHRSPRGLAKGRFSWTLNLYLQEHYTSSADSAHTLTAYLQSVDDAPRGKPRSTAAKSQPRAARASAGSESRSFFSSLDFLFQAQTKQNRKKNSANRRPDSGGH